MVQNEHDFGCVICGESIACCSGEGNWLQEYRAVYTSSEGVFVSGVGLYTSSSTSSVVYPPSDPGSRWNQVEFCHVQGPRIRLGRECSLNDRHGFIVHDACWSIFQKVVGPDDVLLQRFEEIYRSTPLCLQRRSVSCFLGYGGLMTYRTDCQYPWEEKWYPSDQDNLLGQNTTMHPFDAISTEMMIESPPELVKSQLFPQGQDSFTVLPFEIREMIAKYLPTTDVLHLRLASRSFLPMFTSQVFWASRFRDTDERSYIFEVRDTTAKVNWMNLYRVTNPNRHGGLQNRKRIWELCRAIGEVLRLRLDRHMTVPAIIQRCKIESSSWTQIGARVVQTRFGGYGFFSGCRLFHVQSARVPEGSFRIAVFVVVLGQVQYICGLRLISGIDEDVPLGYINEDRQHVLDVDSGFRGFRLAIHSRGIRGLQVIGRDEQESEWIGDREGMPVTDRLGLQGIEALEVGIDGYKIVSLGVACSTRYQVSNDQCRSSLRRTALWYPAVPGPGISLNIHSFTGPRSYATGFEPLAWVRFGGPNGAYLSHLTRITVGIQPYALSWIAFHYDITVDGKDNCYQLGRSRVPGGQEEFLIDGRHGERITRVEVRTAWLGYAVIHGPPEGRALSSIRLTTNWDRSAHFTFNYTGDVSTWTPLSIDEGTTITGLYSHHPLASGLPNLGVLSEDI